MDADEIVDECIGCWKPLTQAEIAYSYNDGPVACATCAPTPEEEEAHRVECFQATGGECSDRCGLEARCFPPAIEPPA